MLDLLRRFLIAIIVFVFVMPISYINRQLVLKEGNYSFFFHILYSIKIRKMIEPTIDFRNCDCFDTMKDMKDNSIKLIVTDPPYGINFSG